MSRNKIIRYTVFLLIFVYIVLLIPEGDPEISYHSGKKAFVWDMDSLWLLLENEFVRVRYSDQIPRVKEQLGFIDSLLNNIHLTKPDPASEKFLILEKSFFKAAPFVGAMSDYVNEYCRLYSKMRFIVKDQSLHWDINSKIVRDLVYRLLYGGRAAVEEIMLQFPDITVSPELMGFDEPSVSPKADILGVDVHSGDILVSRGGAPTSALIARGNDYPGNFSHIALVYVDEKTHLVSVIESHIESGVTISSLEEYLGDKKLRVMVLRLRHDLPKMKNDPLIPHKAALLALNDARQRYIPYDFEMNFKDPSKQFCSEVAFAPYSSLGINFWQGKSNISSKGIVKWLSYFGVRNFETHQPSDLEYDPQLRVAAEWRDPETLYKDHVDNAVIEAMLERANEGKDLEYSVLMLPFARIAKAYSSLLNLFGTEGIIPEGMSATAALRNEQLGSEHKKIKSAVLQKAEEFKKQNGYVPPYWQLVKFAEEAAGA